MTYYHRIKQIGGFFFIEKDREQDAPKTYRERIPIPFPSKEAAIAAIEMFRSPDDDNYLRTESNVVWKGE